MQTTERVEVRGEEVLLQMERDLGAMFGREVDMVERKLVEANPNWMRRKSILESAQLLYAA